MGNISLKYHKSRIKMKPKDNLSFKEKEEKKNRIIKNKVLVKTKKFNVEKILF